MSQTGEHQNVELAFPDALGAPDALYCKECSKEAFGRLRWAGLTTFHPKLVHARPSAKVELGDRAQSYTSHCMHTRLVQCMEECR